MIKFTDEQLGNLTRKQFRELIIQTDIDMAQINAEIKFIHSKFPEMNQ